MTSDNAAGTAAGGRKLRIALIVSLALNVLIIGAVAGTLLVSSHHGWRGHGHRGLLGFARMLPAERADVLREKIRSQQPILDPLRKTEREARAAARELLIAEPFDVEKLKAAMERVVVADGKEKSARYALFAETVATLTPEERQQLHAWFEKRHKHYERRRKEREAELQGK